MSTALGGGGPLLCANWMVYWIHKITSIEKTQTTYRGVSSQTSCSVFVVSICIINYYHILFFFTEMLTDFLYLIMFYFSFLIQVLNKIFSSTK